MDICSVVVIIGMLCVGVDCFCKLHPGPPAVQEANLTPQSCSFCMLRQTGSLVFWNVYEKIIN